MGVRPANLPNERIIKGADFEPTYELRDADGELIDLTHVSVTDVFYRVLPNGASDAVVVRKKTEGSSSLEVTSSGRITPKIAAAVTAAWVGSLAAVEILVEIAGKRSYHGVGTLTLLPPTTGAQA